MKYNFNEIEAKWQKYWAKNKTFAAKNPENGAEAQSPKFYVLDMFPYPSGAGLHVGHPLGYIASDIYSRYKRHQGFNVLHPMGYDSFGLPAEQYAIQTGQHPAITTEANIKRYREQLDNMGFSFDWDREVRTSDPNYYKWTQWIFIQLFNSWYNKDTDKAEDISTLVSKFEFEGNANVNAVCDEDVKEFTAAEWKNYSSEDQQKKLLKYRLTYLAEAEVNWCPALGTVLANDEIVNGVSERGGHPVVRKKMTQWSMRISAYAQRLIDGLDKLDWPQPLKDSQINWIGRSEGASVEFRILPPTPSKGGGGSPGYLTGKPEIASLLLERAKEMRANPTKAESALWQCLKGKKLDVKFRQQHLIDAFIADFVCLDRKLIIEVDGDIHDFQQEKDKEREDVLKELGYTILRFKNEEVLGDIDSVISKIKNKLKVLPSGKDSGWEASGKDLGWEISVFTTRPDTIFGVTFMTLAPELELVKKITTPEQKAEVDAYIEATAKRSERDRMADVKTITGAFTGAYAEHPFTGEAIPIWIGDYVLAGYGTGAVMAVPSGDQRDYDFAKHFNIPIINIFEGIDISEGAYAEKDDTKLVNSGFLNGFSYKEATRKIIDALEEKGVGKGKINYRLRDAVFSRQRYWGEPFPVYYVNGLPQMIDKKHLPIELPEVEKYLPTVTGEPPLGNATEWAWDTKNNKVVSNNLVTLSAVEGSHEDNGIYPLELNTMPGWAGSSWYFNRYMDAGNTEEFASQEALNYWKDVDLYIGGSEHATGHLLYSRFWQKFLYDRGLVPVDEYAKKLINQGMILGESAKLVKARVYIGTESRHKFDSTLCHDLFGHNGILNISCDYFDENFELKGDNIFIEKHVLKSDLEKVKNKIRELKKPNLIDSKFIGLLEEADFNIYYEIYNPYVEISHVKKGSNNELDVPDFVDSRRTNKTSGIDYEIWIAENGQVYSANSKDLNEITFKVRREVEKMSKSKYNVVNPDDICREYGADTLRLYEMFLGPLEQAKPWNTAGITGVHSFLKKLWKLYHSGPDDTFFVSDTPPLEGQGEALKTLHKTIKKVREDIENFSFNTSVSAFMIAVNELTAQKCHSRTVLEPLAIIISPYAPHIAEELWEALGHTNSISKAPFPEFEEKYLVESSKEYPVSFNGKTRFKIELPLDMNVPEIEKAIMADERTQQQLQGREPKKVIIVPGKIINIVG